MPAASAPSFNASASNTAFCEGAISTVLSLIVSATAAAFALAVVKYKLLPSAKSSVVLFDKFSSVTFEATNLLLPPSHLRNCPFVIPVKSTLLTSPTLAAPIRASALAFV